MVDGYELEEYKHDEQAPANGHAYGGYCAGAEEDADYANMAANSATFDVPLQDKKNV